MHSTLHLRRAARVVAAGGIIAYPTEGVFGLGCDPLNVASLREMLTLKGRDARKGFIIIAADLSQLAEFISIPDETVRQRVMASWPGPHTWVLPAKPDVHPLLSGGRNTVAVRVTAHPVAAALCQLTGALVSTSANLSGHPPPRDGLGVRLRLGTAVDYIVPGEVGELGGATEVRDGLTGRVIRQAVARPVSR